MRYWLRRVVRKRIRNYFASSVATATSGAFSQSVFLIGSFFLSSTKYFTFMPCSTEPVKIVAGRNDCNLLDECVDRRLTRELADHSVITVPRRRWAGLSKRDRYAQKGCRNRSGILTFVLAVEQVFQFFLQLSCPAILFCCFERIHGRPVIFAKFIDEG